MKYQDRNRKNITLPSGAQIVIAKLNGFCEPFIVSKKEDEMTGGVRLARFCLVNPQNGELRFEGEAARIVDKAVAEPGEITIAEIEQADADMIVKEVIVFSGLNSAGREARKTFPEKSKNGDERPSAGRAVSRAADRDLETADR